MGTIRRVKSKGNESGFRAVRPGVERMEARALLATLVVTGVGDTIAVDGTITLREAITAANTNAASGDATAGDAGMDTIAFNIPGSGVQTITLATALPSISEPITINGTSQPGSSANTLAVGDNAVLKIELDGTNIANNIPGLLVTGTGGGSTIRGLVINRFAFSGAQGIELRDSNGNTIVGNFIGTNSLGTAALVNNGGIRVRGGGNQIGSAAPADRNLISGNGIAIFLQNTAAATTNTVQGNYIGVDASGSIDLVTDATGNFGIFIQGVFQGATQGATVIGGTTATSGSGAGNVISGINGPGILIDNISNSVLGAVTIQGNIIGLGVDGTTPLGNSGGGIRVLTEITSTNGALLIGGPSPSLRNIISSNVGDGITYSDSSATVQGNYIGTDITGTLDRGNTVLGIQILGDRRDPADSAATTMTIGGTAAGAGNLISANGIGGISVRNADVLVQGNRIGTQIDGTTALSNGGPGVHFFNVVADPVLQSVVGGAADGAGNIIAFSGIGVDSSIRGVTILRNSMFGHTVRGIGSNAFAPAPPVLTGTTATTISGTLSGTDGTTLRLEFFATPGELNDGKTFLGTRDVTIAGAGGTSFTFDPPGGVPAGQNLTATATDVIGTSVFSAAISLPGTVTPADLAVAVADAPDPVAAGGNLAYTIVVTNKGTDAAQGVTLAANVPAGTTFVSFVAPTGWVVTAPAAGATGVINVTNPSLQTGPATFTLVVRVDPGTAPSSILNFSAGVATLAGGDPTPADNSAAVTTTVAAVPPTNTAPTAAPDAYAAIAGQVLVIPARGVLSNDTDPQGTALSAVIVTGPTHGSIVVKPDGSFTYTPVAGFAGVDSFSYRASDGLLFSAPATVTITVAAAAAGDTIGPRITGIQRFGFHAQPTNLVVAFDEALAQVGTSDLANYRLVAAGRDGRFGTRDDVTIALRSATLDPATGAVRIVTRSPLPLRHRYRLTVGGLTDRVGNRLDGDNDGRPGGDAVLTFNRSILAGRSDFASQARRAAVARTLKAHAASR